ncbi:hypothetical protein GL2_40960 [Microbulbifer sp. GL-2]|nr:hypothetical protein GL2_40960 [Microbulbifer sp. GL-2]
MCVRLVMLSGCDINVGYIHFLPRMLILGVIISSYNPAIVTMAISAVDSFQSSLAGASIYILRLVGEGTGA